MPKFSDNPDIQARFENLNTRLKYQIRKMPPLDMVHDANKPGEIRVVPYNLRAYAFLEEYKKDLDADRCLKMLKIPKSTYEGWLTEAKFTDVINRIHQAYEEAILMDAKTVAGWSVEILRDIHNRYKEGDSKSAGALAAMAGNLLRASGNFKDGQVNRPQVLIQINTSNSGNATVKEIKASEPMVNVTPVLEKQEKPKETEKQLSDININIKPNVRKNISDLSILRGTQQS